jgi:DNA-binding winged helix-turn-helix (wHTH) protein
MPRDSKRNHTAASGTYRFGDFELAPADRRLTRRGKTVRLTPKCFDALLLFVRNADRLVRREEMVEALWPDAYVTDANLTNLIVSLRKLLGRRSILTVSKFGYRFGAAVMGEPGIDPAVYDRFVKAKALVTERSLQSMSDARDLLSWCVADDPRFAAAWAWLGRSYRFLEKFEGRPAITLDLAQAALRRALAINPQLACAHHFYTQLQIDLGQSREAAVRLVQRVSAHRGGADDFAGLVHALRFTGLLDESVAAHARAAALDPTVVTSVPHTHFLRCDYAATLETYGQTRYYLDAAAWAALGETKRAAGLLEERLASRHMSPLMAGLLESLLALLQGRRDGAVSTVRGMPIEREPEVVFYVARHLAMAGDTAGAVGMLQRARREGLASSYTLEHDEAFAGIRSAAAFQREVREAAVGERLTRDELTRAGLARALKRA